MRRTVAAAVFNLLLLLATTTPFVFGANVTYNRRGLVIGGERRVLISGSIHYMRSTPEVSSSAFSFTRTERFAVFARILKSCIFPPFLCMNVNVDVARSDEKIKGRRIGCDSNFCFLEFARASSWSGEILPHSSLTCLHLSLSALFFSMEKIALRLFNFLFQSISNFLIICSTILKEEKIW